MKIWPFSKLETRADSFTDAAVAHLLQGASGDADIQTHTTAAEEICAGLWGRAFASAKVTPDNPATRALTPAVLAQIGRQLLSPGESVWEVRVAGGQVFLDNAVSYEIGGERELIYQLTFPRPNSQIIRTLSAARVIHLRYAVDAAEPWKGVGPFHKARSTVRVANGLETRLGDESGARTGYLLPVPQVKPELQADINSLKGKVVLVETTAGGWNQTGEAPKSDYQPRRLGFDPPLTIEPLRDSVSRSLLAAAGVPPSLLGNADGTFARESYRQFLFATIQPISKLIQSELGAKLDTSDLALGFDDLMASDLTGRARAFGSLVQGGMDVEKAAALAGLLVAED